VPPAHFQEGEIGAFLPWGHDQRTGVLNHLYSAEQVLKRAERMCRERGLSRVVALRIVLNKGEGPHRELSIRPVTLESLAASNVCWFCADWIVVACE
jgi:hypothetical protein